MKWLLDNFKSYHLSRERYGYSMQKKGLKSLTNIALTYYYLYISNKWYFVKRNTFILSLKKLSTQDCHFYDI